MNDITHEILSEIHHLLSIATKEELQHAANVPNTSSNIRGALALLAAEKASTSKREVTRFPATPVSRDSDGRQKPGPTSASDMIARELVRSFEKLSKNEIQQACRSVGVHLPMNPKDARERILRRVANSLSKMPPNQRNSILSDLRTKADTQTEGWVGVIRKGR